MRLRVTLQVLLIFVVGTIVVLAQDVAPEEVIWVSRPYSPQDAVPSIRIESNLVEVAAVVLDNRGKPVVDLTRNDFTLLDDGKPQTLSTFSVQSDSTSSVSPGASGGEPPTRYVALYFDDTNSTPAALVWARQSALKFLRSGLGPHELVGIFTASGDLHVDFTDEQQKLVDGVAKLRLLQNLPEEGACPRMSIYQAWRIVHAGEMTQEFRAATNAASLTCCGSDLEGCIRREAERITSIAEDYAFDTLRTLSHTVEILRRMPGQRALVLASSGFLTLSFGEERQQLIESALRSGIVINSLDTNGVTFDDDFGSHFNLTQPLSELAAATGGRFLHNSNRLDVGWRELTDGPSNFYLLGFVPPNLKADGQIHSLKVKINGDRKVKISARPSYTAPSSELSPSEKKFRKLQQSVTSADELREMSARFSATPEQLASGNSALKISMHVDARNLSFRHLSFRAIGDREVERLVMITSLWDEKNQFLSGLEGVMDLRLKAPTLKDLLARGIDASFSINAPPGKYRVRQVIQEVVDGRVAAASSVVSIN